MLNSTKPVFVFLAATYFLIFLLTPTDMIHRGQIIKQQEVFSIAKSLKESWHPLKTYLPCEGATPGDFKFSWASEPPAYHYVAATVTSLGLTKTTATGFLLALVFAFFLTRPSLSLFDDSKTQSLFAVVVATSPIFLRYVPQMLPDFMASVFLMVGALYLFKGRFTIALFFFLISTTTKFLMVVPALSMIGWYLFEDVLFGKRRWNKSLGQMTLLAIAMALLIAPFFFWVKALNHYDVASPFNFNSLSGNRHSGTWEVLASSRFWSLSLKWVFSNGIGVPLSIGLFALWFGGLKRKQFLSSFKSLSHTDRLMTIWALSLIPFMLLTRTGWMIHDYYFFSFFFPFGYFGFKGVLSFSKPMVRNALLVLSVLIGLTHPLKLTRGEPAKSFGPICGAEVVKYLNKRSKN